jgi:hypothetical protein
MRCFVWTGSSALNLNLAHLEANGSMILLLVYFMGVKGGEGPRDIITDETETSDFGVCFHCSSECRLSVLSH